MYVCLCSLVVVSLFFVLECFVRELSVGDRSRNGFAGSVFVLFVWEYLRTENLCSKLTAVLAMRAAMHALDAFKSHRALHSVAPATIVRVSNTAV